MSERVFSADEFSERLRAVQAAVIARGLDALLVTRQQNIFYVSGFRASHFSSPLSELHVLVVPASGAPCLMTRALEKKIAALQWTEEPRLFMDHEDPYAVLHDMLASAGLDSAKLGIEERFMSIRQFSRVKGALPRATFEDAGGLIELIAARSSPAEIAALRQAARVTNIGFEAGIAAVGDGVYPYEIVGFIHKAMYGAGQSDFDMSMVCVWAGATGGRMHDTLSTERLKPGDAVTIEIFGVDNQYKVAAQGTVFVGRPPSDEVARGFGTLVDMFKGARDAVKPGMTAGDIYDAANQPYKARWGTDYYRKVGGSMGLTTFNIGLVKGNTEVLVPGTCLLVQVLIDDPTLLTCSSTVLVSDDGYETLTHPVTELRVV